jgi:Prealbumin-like fold domain
MSFVKPTGTLALTIILAISMLVTAAVSFSSLIYVKSNGNLLSLSYAERAVVVGGEKQNDIKSAENKTSPAALSSSTNQVHGTLVVMQKVNNEGGGNKKPSDFMINVHSNDPSPGSFPGNSSGTSVKLNMGMYSVTETGPSGYKSTLSGDCSGGMMSVETKNCIITSIYSKPGVSVK